METIIPFIAAFFIGGAFCAFFQMIQDHTHSIPPRSCWWASGRALAAALGIMAALGGFAGAGTGILVIGFGEAVYMAIQQLLGGDWTGVLTNFVVLTIFCLMGVIAGAGHLARTKDKKDDSTVFHRLGTGWNRRCHVSLRGSRIRAGASFWRRVRDVRIRVRELRQMPRGGAQVRGGAKRHSGLLPGMRASQPALRDGLRELRSGSAELGGPAGSRREALRRAGRAVKPRPIGRTPGFLAAC